MSEATKVNRSNLFAYVYNTKWAEHKKVIYDQLCTLIQPALPQEPWKTPGTRRGGNSSKWLHYYLEYCERQGIVRLERVQDTLDETSFYGIIRIHVLDQGRFKNYLFPLPTDLPQATEENPTPDKKTIMKRWKDQGFTSAGDTVMHYDARIFKRMKEQRIKPKRSSDDAAIDPTATKVLKSNLDLLCSLAVQQDALTGQPTAQALQPNSATLLADLSRAEANLKKVKEEAEANVEQTKKQAEAALENAKKEAEDSIKKAKEEAEAKINRAREEGEASVQKAQENAETTVQQAKGERDAKYATLMATYEAESRV
jgi:hypothetical protein